MLSGGTALLASMSCGKPGDEPYGFDPEIERSVEEVRRELEATGLPPRVVAEAVRAGLTLEDLREALRGAT